MLDIVHEHREVAPRSIPFVDFRSESLPRDNRFAAWCHWTSRYRVHIPSTSHIAQFGVESRAWLLRDLIVAQTDMSPMHFERTPALIRSDGLDTYNFVLTIGGSSKGSTESTRFVTGAGQIAVLDLLQPFAFESEATSIISVIVGRAALERHLGYEPNVHGHILSGPTGGLLIDYFIALVRHLPILRQKDVAAVTDATLGHIASALKGIPRQQSQGRPSAVRYLARRYIERSLCDLDLTPDRLAADLGLARSTLYRTFQPIGGVAAYIQHRRLEAARILLSNPTELRSVADVARTFRFANAAHFTTAFRRAYGQTPSALRRKLAAGLDPNLVTSDPVTDFSIWIAQLSRQ